MAKIYLMIGELHQNRIKNGREHGCYKGAEKLNLNPVFPRSCSLFLSM